MRNRITAAPHWALKGLSRKWMFWLNSSHFKNSCGDKRWAEQRGLMPGRTSKTFKKDTTAGILQGPTNRTANVSTGNNNGMNLTDFCPMLLCPGHFWQASLLICKDHCTDIYFYCMFSLRMGLQFKLKRKKDGRQRQRVVLYKYKLQNIVW